MRRTVSRFTSAVLLLALVAGAIWAAMSLQTALVPSASMEPELQAGDLLMVRRDAYRNGRTCARGDIVMFEQPGEPDYFVKRVIGLPGETLFIVSGRVALDNRRLQEPYADHQRVMEMPLMVRLGEDEYFLMGDNRGSSEDSRDFGPVPADSIRGKVTAVIAPWARRGALSNPFEE